MLDFVNSLSFESGALIVAGLSMLPAIGWGFLRKTRLKWTLALTVPYLFAHSLYWLPVWLGEHPSEFSAWSVIFIVPWYLAGAISSALVAYLTGRWRRDK